MEIVKVIEAKIGEDGRKYFPKIELKDDELEPKEHKEYIIRHEILHAFLAESGLRRYREDEDIINWIAWNFKKIQKVFSEVMESEEE